MATKARERLNSAALSKNAKDVEEVLAEFIEAGDIVESSYKALERHFETMKETMRRKLGAALNQVRCIYVSSNQSSLDVFKSMLVE